MEIKILLNSETILLLSVAVMVYINKIPKSIFDLIVIVANALTK